MSESDDLTAEHARTAAQIDADVGIQHIAEVYAKAVLDAAESAANTEGLLEEFDLLISDVLQRYPRLEAVLTSDLISPDDKAGILDRVFGGRASPMFIHFLKVVSRHGRLDCLRAIHRQVRVQYEKLRGRIEVRVATATPLDRALAGRIAENLRAVLGGEPLVKQVVDPELIGGVVVRVGDTVYDGSIGDQLRRIREQIIDRSVHEIQSRRDRFRYPAGN